MHRLWEGKDKGENNRIEEVWMVEAGMTSKTITRSSVARKQTLNSHEAMVVDRYQRSLFASMIWRCHPLRMVCCIINWKSEIKCHFHLIFVLMLHTKLLSNSP